MTKFRFQELVIWQRPIMIGNKLIGISENLQEVKKI